VPYPIILQHSEEDCGAACLATITKHYGRTFTLTRIREAVGTGARGTTLLGLRRGAEVLGFHARPAQANPKMIEHLKEAPLPLIIHWKGNHWVVLYRQQGKKYLIADPAVGIRNLSHEELLAGWQNGVMLLLQPDEESVVSGGFCGEFIPIGGFCSKPW
jgi:ABC-type bacteriocin/lantibiotic exporter with double-glycine peptidase domain